MKHLFPYEWTLRDAVFTKDQAQYSLVLLVVVARLWVISWQDLTLLV